MNHTTNGIHKLFSNGRFAIAASLIAAASGATAMLPGLTACSKVAQPIKPAEVRGIWLTTSANDAIAVPTVTV